MSLEKVTVFKVKNTVSSFDEFVRAEDRKGRQLPALAPLNLPDDFEFDGQIEIAAAFRAQQGARKTEDDIPWLAFLNEGRAEGQEFAFNSRNRYPSALVAIKIETPAGIDFYALTFGLGAESFLNSELIVRDFGLRVAMNICDTNKLKRIQTSIHEAVSTQSEKQISVGSSFSVFNIDDEKEFLRALSGAANEEYGFITSFNGRESIIIKIDKDDSINWTNIIPRISMLGSAYTEERYQAAFPGYAKFRFETDPNVVAELDRILFDRIRARELDNVHLAPPIFVDFEARDFSYSDEEYAPRFEDLVLDDLLNSRRAFSDRSSIKSLRQMKIFVWNADTDTIVDRWTAYKCLVAEVEYNNTAYILSIGQWKQVSNDLKEEVDKYVAAIEPADFDFLLNDINIWEEHAREKADGTFEGQNRESVYNLAVAAAHNDIFLFDTAKVQIAGEKLYEVCDLMHSDKVMLHVKRFTSGAASITHLFLQGRFYGEAFLTDEGCRRSMCEYISANIGARDPAPFLAATPQNRDELIANAYTIVFCILSTRANVDASSLPFMDRYELMYTHRHLHNALGFKCKIAFRRVETGPQ